MNLPVDRSGSIWFLTVTLLIMILEASMSPGMSIGTTSSHFVPFAGKFPSDLTFQLFVEVTGQCLSSVTTSS